MDNRHKGTFFLFYLLFVFGFPHISRVFSNSDSVSIETEYADVLNRHQIQLEKLEELVRNLSELVSRLESRFSSETPKVGPCSDEKRSVERQSRLVLQEKIDSIVKIEDESGLVDAKVVGDGERGRAVSVTKYSPFWSERFQAVSALKLVSDATCIIVLPFRDFEGLSKYVAIGDDRGRVVVFLRNGDVLAEFNTILDSPITAMVSYMSVYKNASFVVTGHSNGLILLHKVWEVSNGEEWTSLSVENVVQFTSPEIGEGGSPITLLEVHHVGRMRYILSTDVSGKIRVFRENGTIFGLAVPTSRPLAFLKQRLLFLTETGAGSLDLRTMKIRESECEGLNHSSVESYVFDATERSKAYGFTSEGDLIHVLLFGDIINFKCRVRSKRKVDTDKQPLAFQAIKGYLLIVNHEKVFVYNVSSQHYSRVGGPRLLFSASLDEIRSSFNYQSTDLDSQKRTVMPLLASDGEKLVILGLGGGHVVMYRSTLPVFKGEFNTMLWTSQVFFFVLFLFVAWQFFAKKKEALISWGPDDPFSSTSITNGAPLGSGPGDRSFTEPSSRGSDSLELRGGGLRGPSRRYVSPSRYPGGSASSFRPSSVDTNSRPSLDPNFRAPSEVKFRGSTLETAGFQKRRESLFVNSQVVEESS
ncbi:putative membrane protein [Camellia lanceoleosa]|uniref:Membrane protein n=1 Tax=Camellia lanceoleosa TaxID=1840588 RepID=A0ACC0GQA6_9ERIC|nr:putative membrane protein [Camellia lanceoleosa]